LFEKIAGFIKCFECNFHNQGAGLKLIYLQTIMSDGIEFDLAVWGSRGTARTVESNLFDDNLIPALSNIKMHLLRSFQ
jgi:hypothetical protein